MKSDRHGLFKLARSGVLNRVAAGVFLGLAANAVYAQSNAEGYVYGTAAPGSTVTIESPTTGSKISVKADSSGKYRVSGLQAGDYKVTNTVGSEASVETVTVKLGEGSQARFGADASGATVLGTIRATASRVKAVDVGSSETSLNIGEKQLDSLPVARDITSVALLSPGTVAGDAGFGNIASFGGSTPSENQYFLNGFNISDLRTRLGPATVPFEFFDQFQIKTGGYGAEFGRSTGGVVNATSKRGTNKWEFQANAYWEPDSLRGTRPDTIGFESNNPTPRAGSPELVRNPLFVFSRDATDVINYNIGIGGPIIKDKLFFYALGNIRSTETTRVLQTANTNSLSSGFRRGAVLRESDAETPFGAVKLDWQIADGHKFEYTGFSDKSDDERTAFGYSRATDTIGAATGTSVVVTGGQTSIYRYTGNITTDFKVSALFGRGVTSSSSFPPAANINCPLISDETGAAAMQLGCFVANPLFNTDKRKAYRLDLEYNLGDFLVGSHIVRVGADAEKNTSVNISRQAGGSDYTVVDRTAGQSFDQASNLTAPDADRYVEVGTFIAGGQFKENLSALYIEDEWAIGPVTMNLGARRETFENLFPDGSTYVELKSKIAPRLGVSWDVFQDGNSKLYGTYGDYYIPIGTQAAVRNGGGEFNVVDVYRFEGYGAGPELTPILGQQVGSQTFSNGTSSDPTSLVDPKSKPSYQTEMTAGFQTVLPEQYFGSKASGGVRFIYRDLKRTLEDIAVDSGLNALLAGNPNVLNGDCDGDGAADAAFACGFDFYFLTNPGNPTNQVAVDVNSSGQIINTHAPVTDANGDPIAAYQSAGLTPLTVSNADMRYATPKRKYYAVELTYEKSFSKKWFLSSSYTWSQSFGNYEGFINSDIEQSDVGITQDFDQPGLADNANGFLPNDRRHKFKLFGSYRPTEEWNFGGNLQANSGRPYSFRGIHPTDAFARAYGAFSFFRQGQPANRGEAGKTAFTTQLDLNVKYTPAILQSKATFGVDVFNVLDSDKETEVYERADNSRAANGTYVANQNFGIPTNYQAPRFVRLSAEVRF